MRLSSSSDELIATYTTFTQKKLDEYFEKLNSASSELLFSYRTFINYISQQHLEDFPHAYNNEIKFICDTIVKELMKITKGNDIYLANKHAYVYNSLKHEFPELKIFKIKIDESFIQSSKYPNIWIETRKFSKLRSLADMRREIQHIGFSEECKKEKAINLVAMILGIELEVR
jgi:hypothetical protein